MLLKTTDRLIVAGVKQINSLGLMWQATEMVEAYKKIPFRSEKKKKKKNMLDENF